MHDIIFDTFNFLVEKFHFKFYKIKTGIDFIICYKFYKDDYVFYLKYDYSNRNFKKPVFIKKVYERDGCKYANEVMGW